MKTKFDFCDLFGDAITSKDLADSEYCLNQFHPLNFIFSDVIDSSGYFNCMMHNTVQGIKNIFSINNDWFLKKKPIILSKEAELSNGVLGEIRCYNSLVDAFGSDSIIPLKTEEYLKTPDFKIKYDSFEIFVEVNTPQINGDEAKKLKEHDETNNKNETIKITERCIAPFGYVEGSSLLHRVVSKINGIKGKVEQLKRGNINILWIDLQSEHILDACFWIEKFSPYYSDRQSGGNVEGVYSNPLWYSLYASKETPIFNGQALKSGEGNRVSLELMQFSSKFSNSDFKHISAIVFSGASSLILCENPYASHRLPISFIRVFTTIPRFKIENSIISFPGGTDIKQQIRESLKRIESFSKENFYSW